MAPPVFVAANGLLFLLLRPDVPDLWAARARAAAVSDGVGLTYWFSWFGGATPGAYSVLTPFLCAVFGTELVAALAAVAISGTTHLLLRGTERPVAAAWMAAVGIVVNLWCGRVPFLVGAAFAVAALAFVRDRRKLPAGAMALVSVLASPVAGAFLGLTLSGVLLAPSTRAYRGTVLLTIACAIGPLLGVALAFGAPGPEPFPAYMLLEVGTALALMLFLAPPHQHLRVILVVSALAAVVVFLVPNGLGGNFTRLALFCLPAAAVALSRNRPRTVLLMMVPILGFGGLTSVSAAQSTTEPSSHAAYYSALAARVDTLPDIGDHRLELVHVGHAAYAALLGHATLARGWETQADRALNRVLERGPLDSRRYRTWLEVNAVGYVAIDGAGSTAEARLIRRGHLDYLLEIWRHDSWRLYEVLHPTPIVAGPAVLESSDQAAMRVRVPCACRTLLRIRWSRFLTVSPSLPRDAGDAVEDSYRPSLAADGSGWTVLTTDRAGTYVLRGLL
ncbi:hypothetical protein [Nocardioides sp. CER19]|uniref:hypothetical protein n=1 Tax=Nocardioides sp. CER19 TaxID=3038538 RepID=UPI00244A9B4C|nr:hypothetical protein [Nocardioides sp. CER19]MDH2416270.1 hypothetical protein [Nocardioides sp. CER19]